MNRERQSKTSTIPFPTEYVTALLTDYNQWAYTEEEAPKLKGLWRKEAFNISEQASLDLEIGTGNGTHFAHYLQKHPHRNLIGLELKYKPLIQSIRRARNNKSTNGRMARYNASFPQDLFNTEELDNIFIHFPDPWPKKRQKKNRLINTEFLDNLYTLQKKDSLLEFKTDSLDYFNWSVEFFEKSPYQLIGKSFDLHNSEFSEQNYVTQFENIFLRKNQKINYILLKK